MKIISLMAAFVGSFMSGALAVDLYLHEQALAESAQPVRPGMLGGQPFWNQHAVQFQYAPSFDFKEVAGATSYGFTITPLSGGEIRFEAPTPTTSLASVWTKVPVGKTTLRVEAMDAKGATIGSAMSRVFHRAAVFDEETPAAASSWNESARTALNALVHSRDLRCWFTTGEIEEEFHLYRYPAKIIGAAASTLAVYAGQAEKPADAAEALKAARRAADVLLGMCESADSAWAFHPPTYHPSKFRDRLQGHMGAGYYMTNCGAEAGRYFLDVYVATQDAKYLGAAVRIAETYAKQQRQDGSWLLFVTPKDGQPATDNVLIPTSVIEFIDHLDRVTQERRFDGMRERAVAWIMQNPVRTWNWQGQFEDVKPLPPYENLTKHEGCDFAIHLLSAPSPSPEDQKLALDLLRFAEDQFVMWSQPPVTRPGTQNDDGNAGAKSKRWMLPCVLEQYRCYAPVCASSAKLIRTYLAAYRVTHDTLHLHKARALAATLTRTQNHPKAPGRYQTWVMQNPGPMWFNCELMAVRAMQELAAMDRQP